MQECNSLNEPTGQGLPAASSVLPAPATSSDRTGGSATCNLAITIMATVGAFLGLRQPVCGATRPEASRQSASAPACGRLCSAFSGSPLQRTGFNGEPLRCSSWQTHNRGSRRQVTMMAAKGESLLLLPPVGSCNCEEQTQFSTRQGLVCKATVKAPARCAGQQYIHRSRYACGAACQRQCACAAVKGYVKLALDAGKANPAPPVGPALGAKVSKLRILFVRSLRWRHSCAGSAAGPTGSLLTASLQPESA